MAAVYDIKLHCLDPRTKDEPSVFKSEAEMLKYKLGRDGAMFDSMRHNTQGKKWIALMGNAHRGVINRDTEETILGLYGIACNFFGPHRVASVEIGRALDMGKASFECLPAVYYLDPDNGKLINNRKTVVAEIRPSA